MQWLKHTPTACAERVGLWVPGVEVFEDAFDDTGIVDECDDAHGGATASALERIDFVDFLNQPCPVGGAPVVGRWLVNAD